MFEIESFDYLKATLYLISCTVSITFTSIGLYFFIKFADIKTNFASKLIFILSISDLLCWSQIFCINLYILISHKTNYSIPEWFCSTIAFTITLCSFSLMFVVFLISFLIYLTSIWNINVLNYKRSTFITVTLLILILSLIPFFTNSYGSSSNTSCWIIGTKQIFFNYYLIVLSLMMFDGFCIYQSIKKIKQYPIQLKLQKKLIKHITFFPFILIFSYSAGIINTINCLINGDENSIEILELLDVVFEPLDGICNPIAYMLINEKVYNGVKSVIFKNKNNIPIQREDSETPFNLDI